METPHPEWVAGPFRLLAALAALCVYWAASGKLQAASAKLQA